MSADSVDGHRQRLRERFQRTGFEGFAEHEKLELILTLCIPRRDVKPAAKALLARFKTLRGVLDAPPDELAEVRGIGPITPINLQIIRESASLYLRQTAERGQALNTGQRLEDFWRHRLSGLRIEVFEVAYLDKSCRLLPDGVERLERGSVDQTSVYPRKVMEAALRRGASNLVVAHNHPTGSPRPSPQDLTLTEALVQSARPLGIELLDHLIVGREEVFSFRKTGKLLS